jgi:hypothetical protein
MRRNIWRNKASYTKYEDQLSKAIKNHQVMSVNGKKKAKWLYQLFYSNDNSLRLLVLRVTDLIV